MLSPFRNVFFWAALTSATGAFAFRSEIPKLPQTVHPLKTHPLVFFDAGELAFASPNAKRLSAIHNLQVDRLCQAKGGEGLWAYGSCPARSAMPAYRDFPCMDDYGDPAGGVGNPDCPEPFLFDDPNYYVTFSFKAPSGGGVYLISCDNFGFYSDCSPDIDTLSIGSLADTTITVTYTPDFDFYADSIGGIGIYIATTTLTPGGTLWQCANGIDWHGAEDCYYPSRRQYLMRAAVN